MVTPGSVVEVGMSAFLDRCESPVYRRQRRGVHHQLEREMRQIVEHGFVVFELLVELIYPDPERDGILFA